MEMVPIPLSNTLREHMRRRVASGDFKSEGEYLQSLVALDRERITTLRRAIQEGLDSGFSERSIEEIFEDAKRRYLETQD